LGFYNGIILYGVKGEGWMLVFRFKLCNLQDSGGLVFVEVMQGCAVICEK